MICIAHPPTYSIERRYVFDVLIREFLGLEYRAQTWDRKDVRLFMANDPSSRELRIEDVLFQTPEHEWLKPASLPAIPLRSWDVSQKTIDARLVTPEIPVLYGRALSSGSFISSSAQRIELGIDIFGSAFFMLTRYEELVKCSRDAHGRLPLKDSITYQEGFLERPLINEYLEIFWTLLQRLWPSLTRKTRSFRVCLSHDVDWPWSGVNTTAQVMRSACGDLARRRDALLAGRRILCFIEARRGKRDRDIYNTFDFIMGISERHGLRSAFNFMAAYTTTGVDGGYSIDDPWIKELLRRCSGRGHEIGLHPSYETFRDPERTRREFEALLRVCAEIGIEQSSWGGRQHFLRWENPITWQNLEYAQVNYDSSLTFAEKPGFRCGVCYEYPVFNLDARTALKLRERPLIVMEGTLFEYMRLPDRASYEVILELKKTCKLFDGDFTLLWHNSSLISRREKELYREVIKGLTA